MKLADKLRSFWCPNPQRGTPRINKARALGKGHTKKVNPWVIILLTVTTMAVLVAVFFALNQPAATTVPPPSNAFQIDNASIIGNTTIAVNVSGYGSPTIIAAYVDSTTVNMYNSSGYEISSITIPPRSIVQITLSNATAHWADGNPHELEIKDGGETAYFRVPSYTNQ